MPKRVAKARAWLFKSEPGVYSIDDLARDKTTGWEGVRNFQARNSLRDEVRPGDLVLFYHSNAEPSGIAGLARVSGPPATDPSQFDPTSEFYDPSSSRDAPRWQLVRVAFVERFRKVLSLEQLKGDTTLSGMALLQAGSRLSVQPVERRHLLHVLKLAGAKTR